MREEYRMIRQGRRRLGVAAIALASGLGLISAACTPAGYGGPPAANYRFETDKVEVVNSQDKVCVLFCVNASDELYTLNIAFRAKLQTPGSAQTFVVQGTTTPSTPEGSSHTMVGGERAQTNFPGVIVPDLLDLAQGSKVEVAGIWSWQMEEDFIGVNSAANTVAGILQSALNSTVAAAELPSDANQIVSTVLSALGIGGAFSILGTNLLGVTGLQDDCVGSRMYVGIGASGALAGIIDAAVGSASFPTLALPLIKIPPDIEGGRIFRLGGLATWTDHFDQPSVDGDYNTTFVHSTY
jgi:hypothetical protein